MAKDQPSRAIAAVESVALERAVEMIERTRVDVLLPRFAGLSAAQVLWLRRDYLKRTGLGIDSIPDNGELMTDDGDRWMGIESYRGSRTVLLAAGETYLGEGHYDEAAGKWVINPEHDIGVEPTQFADIPKPPKTRFGQPA